MKATGGQADAARVRQLILARLTLGPHPPFVFGPNGPWCSLPQVPAAPMEHWCRYDGTDGTSVPFRNG